METDKEEKFQYSNKTVLLRVAIVTVGVLAWWLLVGGNLPGLLEQVGTQNQIAPLDMQIETEPPAM